MTSARTHDVNPIPKVLSSAAIGQFVEWYDFTVYAYTASVIASLFFPTDDRIVSLLATFGVYGVGFVMRPLGAIVFGHLGDRVGRRNILAAIILLMGAATALIGVIPTHDTIGVWAPLLLIVFRLIQGASAGAETAGANSLVAEYAPEPRRGLYVAFTYSFANIPAIFAALLVLFLTNLLGESSFESWGWRIPFLLAGVISLIGLYIRMHIDETPEFQQAQQKDEVERFPLLTAIRDHPAQIFHAFSLAALASLGFYTLTGYFVTYLRESVELSSNEALLSNSIAVFLAFITMPIAGFLSDQFGRKELLIFGAFASAVCAYPAYILASSGDFIPAVMGQGIFAIAVGLFFGPFGVAFLEIFPVEVRFSGAAFGYNLAYVIFGGTAPYFSLWLVNTTGSLLAPAAYMAIVAVTVAIISFFLPKAHAVAKPTPQTD